MGLIKARLRRSKEPSLDEVPQPTPEPIEPIKRYRVQSVPAQKPQLQYSRSVCSHKDDFSVVTQAWKRESGRITILEPSETSIRSNTSVWSSLPSLESHLEVKPTPKQRLEMASVSPTFSLCGSELSPSPSLDYSGSVSSNSSGWSYQDSLRSQQSFRSQRSQSSSVDAGIPPLLPAHRTFSGSPHYGSFCKQRQAPDAAKTHARTASDYIPIHVFTRECKQPERPLQMAKHGGQLPTTKSAPAKYEKRFSLDGYAGKLKVVNTTPPSSPLPPLQQPVRYRVPSKASLMDH